MSGSPSQTGTGATFKEFVAVGDGDANPAARSGELRLPSGGRIVVRNAANTADVVAATVDDTGLVLPGADALAGVIRCLEFAVARAAAADSATSLPAGSHVYKVRFKIGTQYSAGATLDVGQAGHTTDFANHGAAGADPALSDLSLLAVGDTIDIDGLTTVAGAGAVRASIGGAPAAGAGTLLVVYGVPLS